MNSDSYLYFNIAQEIRLYINSTMKHQLKFYIVLFCGFIVTGKAFCG